MTESQLAELQDAWPGAWERNVSDETVYDRAITLRALGFAYVRADSVRVVGIELTKNQIVFTGHGPDFKTAIAVAKAKFAAYVAPFNTALGVLP